MSAVSQEESSLLTKEIRAEIEASGSIPFARFMELALYHPKCGYYQMEASRIGREGDFITNVSVGEAFGQLLASRFSKWLGEIDGEVRLVEVGAHDGTLARDILVWLAKYNQPLFLRLKYTIVEPSKKRRAWQVNRLENFEDQVEWIDSISDIPRIRGVIFSNELLDAFPVHRISWSQSKRDWFELGVTCQGEEFCWVSMEAGITAWRSMLPAWPDSLLDVLPDQYCTELSPAAIEWWQFAACHLEEGKLVAFDYGHSPDEWPSPNQPQGTVRGYRGHKHVDDILAHPGEQDLTAHANFHLVKKAGEVVGLKTEQFTSQERFLNRSFADLLQESPRIGKLIDPRQLQTLTNPVHMGQSFKVLLQSS